MPSIGQSCEELLPELAKNFQGLVHLSRSCMVPELSASNSSSQDKLTLGSDVFQLAVWFDVKFLRRLLGSSGIRGQISSPPESQLARSVLNRLQTALPRHLLGFFAAGGFFSPPPGLISAKKSLALNG